MVYVARKKVRKKFDKNCDMIGLLESFIQSGAACARVDTSRHCNANSCSLSISATIKRQGLYHIRVIQRKGEVYIINGLMTPVIIP